MIIKILFVAFVGFSGGLAVGAGFVAFLTVLGVIDIIIDTIDVGKKKEVARGNAQCRLVLFFT